MLRVLIACSLAVASLATVAPVISYAPQERQIEGSYIVVFEPDAQDEFAAACDFVRSKAATDIGISMRYEVSFGSFHAMIGDLSERQLEVVRHLAGIAYIEVDSIGEIDGKQTDATWGLDRVDQQQMPLDETYWYDDDSQGKDVLAYIYDTGIHVAQEDFDGRAEFGACFPASDSRCKEDCQGHGTHVAGTVGSTTYGVAKQVKLIAVKVCQGCSGSCRLSEVIAGLEWGVEHHHANRKRALSVLNMSLGFSVSTALNAAIAAASDEGIVPAVSAGNSRGDSCRQSPAAEPKTIAVGSTDNRDSRSSFSNYGKCMDIFAPGSNIVSLANRDRGTATMSGTSMASPHVCGAAAVAVSTDKYSSTDEVRKALQEVGTKDVVSNPGADTLNILLFTDPPKDDKVPAAKLELADK